MNVNKTVVEAWVAALESDEYTQGHDLLHSEDGSMCCLGVLCDLYRKETGQGEWKPRTLATNGGFAFHVPEEFCGESYGLPSPVRAWLGVGASIPVVGGTQLAILNDGPDRKPHLTWSFKQIAAHLRKHLL